MQRTDQPSRLGQQGPSKRVKEMSWMELEQMEMAEQFENSLMNAVKLKNHEAALGFLRQIRDTRLDNAKQRLLNKAFYVALENSKEADLEFALELIKMGAKPYANENGVLPDEQLKETKILGLGVFLKNMWGSDIQGNWKHNSKKDAFFKKLVNITLQDGYGWVLNRTYIFQHNNRNYIRRYLSQAIFNNDDNSVRTLLDAGADPNGSLNTRRIIMYALNNFRNRVQKDGYNVDEHKFAENIVNMLISHTNFKFDVPIDPASLKTNISVKDYIRSFESTCSEDHFKVYCHRPTLFMQQVMEKRNRPGLVRTLSDKAIAVRPEHEREKGQRFDADGVRLPRQPEDDYKWTTDMKHIPEADKFSLPPPIWTTILMQSRRMQLCKDLQSNVNLDKIQALANILRIHLDVVDPKTKRAIRPKTKKELCERISYALAQGTQRWTSSDEKRFRRYLDDTAVNYDRAMNEMKRLAMNLGIDPNKEDYMKQLEIAMKDRIIN